MKNLTMKIMGFLIMILLLTSCSHKVIADFQVTNNTEFDIDSLKIEPNINEATKYISLKKGEMVEYKSDMTTIAKVDGGYTISFIIDGENKVQNFGYYTNGNPLPFEEITKIEIKNDTILIEQILKDY